MYNNNILIQKENESDLEYHRRLLEAKLVDKTTDIDYSVLSEYLYGKPYSSDVARRMAYGSMKTLELIDKNIFENGQQSLPEAIQDIDNKMEELKKERQRFYDQRREYNKLVVTDARREHLEKALIDAASTLDEKIGKLYSEDDRLDSSILCGSNEAVLVFSDWHYGMIAENIFNTYNTDICVERVHKTVLKAIEKIKLHRCNKLHVVLLGDFLHGAIHVSARVASEELVIDQLMNVSEILAQSISELSKYTNETVVYTTYGNHGRIVQNKQDNIHRDNMEKIIGWWLEQRLKDNENISIKPDMNGFIFVNACGHEICAVHGDLDSVKTSNRLLTTLIYKELGKNIECIILGDKHHRESFEELGVTSMLCGALCGSDDYANDRRLYSTPSQMLLIFDDDGIDAEYRLKCV